MHTDDRAKCHLTALSSLGLCVLVALSFITAINAQQPPSTSKPDQEQMPNIPEEALYRIPGTLLEKGHNTVPVGKLKVKSYRLEEVFLPHPVEFETNGPIRRKIRIESKVRLTITGESFSAGPYIIWLNDERLDSVMSGPKELRVVIDDPSALVDKATIEVASGAGCTYNLLSTLPERLRVPARFRPPEKKEHFEGITLKIRRDTSSDASLDRPDVIVEITRTTAFDLSRNASMVAQIGRQDFTAIPTSLKSVTVRMTAEQFARAKDGDLIRIRYAFCSPGGMHVGRLDKSLLDQ